MFSGNHLIERKNVQTKFCPIFWFFLTQKTAIVINHQGFCALSSGLGKCVA